jgi:hypothetical protein
VVQRVEGKIYAIIGGRQEGRHGKNDDVRNGVRKMLFPVERTLDVQVRCNG